jgi:hypothetical protein
MCDHIIDDLIRKLLKDIFGKYNDLASMGGVKNSYLRAELEETRVPVYAAA